MADPETFDSSLFSGDRLRFEAAVSAATSRLAVDTMAYECAGHRFATVHRGNGRYDLESAFPLKRARGRAWPLPEPVKCYGFPDQVRAYYQNAGFLSDFELEFERLFNRTFYLGPLREYPLREYAWTGAQPVDVGRRGENAVGALLSARKAGTVISRGKGQRKQSVEQMVAKWLKDLRLVHDFSVEEIKGTNLYQVTVQRSQGGPRVLITDVGFGVSQILPVLVLCYYAPQGSTILLEQPEIHLHPLVQTGLADVLIDAVRTRGIQVIVESHSEHLLARLQRRIAEGKLKPDETALYFCEMGNGASQLKPLTLDTYGNITNWPRDFFGDPLEERAAMVEAMAARVRA